MGIWGKIELITIIRKELLKKLRITYLNGLLVYLPNGLSSYFIPFCFLVFCNFYFAIIQP